jgi:hypothetical protein
MHAHQLLTGLRNLAHGDAPIEAALETFRVAGLTPEEVVELVGSELQVGDRAQIADAAAILRTALLLAAMRVRGEAPQEDVGEDVGDDDDGERATERIDDDDGERATERIDPVDLGDDDRIVAPWSPGGESNL